jgi:uncharacterized protein
MAAMTSPRMLIWSVDEIAGFDAAWASIEGRRLHADGRAAGLVPDPYWVSYELETADEFVTRRLVVESRRAGATVALDLRRDAAGWTVDGEPRPDLDAALDCDLGACPLTNTMPILRHDLHRGAGDVSLVMAFVEVPSLRVVPSRQRYTHLRTTATGAVVRYRSDGFESDLEIDRDGFVVVYPQLGRRVSPSRAG